MLVGRCFCKFTNSLIVLFLSSLQLGLNGSVLNDNHKLGTSAKFSVKSNQIKWSQLASSLYLEVGSPFTPLLGTVPVALGSGGIVRAAIYRVEVPYIIYRKELDV